MTENIGPATTPILDLDIHLDSVERSAKRDRHGIGKVNPEVMRRLVAIARAAKDYVDERDNPVPDMVLQLNYLGRLREALDNVR